MMTPALSPTSDTAHVKPPQKPPTRWTVAVHFLVGGKHWQTSAVTVAAGSPSLAAKRGIEQARRKALPKGTRTPEIRVFIKKVEAE